MRREAWVALAELFGAIGSVAEAYTETLRREEGARRAEATRHRRRARWLHLLRILRRLW